MDLTFEELRTTVLEKSGVVEEKEKEKWDLWDIANNSLLRDTIPLKPIGDRADEKVISQIFFIFISF